MPASLEQDLALYRPLLTHAFLGKILKKGEGGESTVIVKVVRKQHTFPLRCFPVHKILDTFSPL